MKMMVMMYETEKNMLSFVRLYLQDWKKWNLVWTGKLNKHNTEVTEEVIIGNLNSYHFNNERFELVFFVRFFFKSKL